MIESTKRRMTLDKRPKRVLRKMRNPTSSKNMMARPANVEHERRKAKAERGCGIEKRIVRLVSFSKRNTPTITKVKEKNENCKLMVLYESLDVSSATGTTGTLEPLKKLAQLELQTNSKN
uniref:Uncharacterized protein n=1 Tax=Vespula pensylvanica TaxID=30213 RepID=A0A834KCM1_VESPE|nr:hypothetical protein H0235_014957 [Vespula pensylvanica]